MLLRENEEIRVITIFLVIIIVVVFLTILVNRGKKCDGGPSCTCKEKKVENYANVDIPEQISIYKSEYNTSYKAYKSIELVAPDSEIDSPKNLLFGNAEYYLLNNGKVRLNIRANLYVLGGDAYDSGVKVSSGDRGVDNESSFALFVPSVSNDFYSVKNNGKLIGRLVKDGDGLYKLGSELNLRGEEMGKIEIEYNGESGESVKVIEGSF